MSSEEFPTNIRPNVVYADHFTRDGSYGTRRIRGSGDWLILYTVAGAGRIRMPKESDTVVKAGMYVLYGPEAYQDYSTETRPGKWELLWAHFQPSAEMLAQITALPRTAPSIWVGEAVSSDIRDGLAKALHRAVDSSQSSRMERNAFAMNAVAEVILWVSVNAQLLEKGRGDERIAKATQILAEEYAQTLHVEDLARRCGLSASRFAHLFREETGLTPMRFLERERLRRAGILLRATGLTIGEVAERVGFEDAFYFSRRFRMEFGVSPRTWRGG